jgi:hypothetical protein
MLVVSNFEAMSEPLFLALLLASSACLLPVVVAAGPGGTPPWRRLIGGGLLLGLAILTRPAALYVPAILVLARLIGWARGVRPEGALRRVIAIALAAYLPVGCWIARNGAMFSVPRLTTVDVNNMVYFVGAGAYQIRHRVALEEAQAMIAREFSLPPYIEVQNPWISGRSAAELDDQLRGRLWGAVTRYPGELVLASLLGVLKASFSHNVGELAALLGRAWTAPGTGSLARLRPEALERLRQNGPVLAAAFAWEVSHTLVALGFALVGALGALKDSRTRPAGLLVGGLLLYFYLTVALFGLEAYCRCRIPVLPFLYAFAGWGLAGVGAVRCSCDRIRADA